MATFPGFRPHDVEGLDEGEILEVIRSGEYGPLLPAYGTTGARLMGVETGGAGVDEIWLIGFGRHPNFRESFAWTLPPGDLRAAMEADEAWLGWRHAEISGPPTRPRGETAADLNGDGRLDWIYPYPTEVAWRMVAEEEEQWTSTTSPTGADSRSVRITDANRDGAPDLLITSAAAGTATLLRMPAPGRWRQRLSDGLRPRTPLPPGATEHRLRQSMQRVDRLGVYVRAEGEGLEDLSLVLRSPRGECIELETPPPVDGVLRLHPSWDEVALAPMLGWQPQGEWVLQVENAGEATPALIDFEVLTWGAFVGTEPGSRQSHPKQLGIREGAMGRALRQSTLGGVDTVALSCGDTGGQSGEAPERWYDFEVAERRTVTFSLTADFPAAVELREGACAEGGPVLDCDAGSFAPSLAPRALRPGTWCLVVDGDLQGGAAARSGRFELFVGLDAPWTRPPAAAPAARCDAPEPIARSVECGAAVCEGEAVCCAGFAGTRCAEGGQCEAAELAITCDGPEECGAGQRCCAGFPLGAACVAECGANEQIRCHEDADCDGQRCQPCDFPPVGAVRICADVCP